MPNTAVYEKNVSVLEKTHPALYTKIRTHTPTLQIKPITTTADHFNAAVKCRDGEWLPIYAGDAPDRAAQSLIDEQTYNAPPRILLFNGIGLFHHIAYYLTHPQPGTHFMVVIEPHIDIFVQCMHLYDLSRWLQHDNTELLIGTPPESLHKTFLSYLYAHSKFYYYKCVKWIDLPFNTIFSKDYTAYAKKEFDRAITSYLTFRGNNPTDTLIGIECMAQNFSKIVATPFINDFIGLFKDKPGLVIASGPSLTPNLERLKATYNHFVSVATPSNFELLRKIGITPTMVSVIEREEIMADFFKPLGPITDTFMLASTVITPNTTNAYNGPKIYMNRLDRHYHWFPFDREGFFLGGGCAPMALKALQLLGCNPIIFLGQDLAYDTESGQSHMIGLKPWINTTVDHPRFEVVPILGNSGEMIPSRYDWCIFHNSIELMIAESPGTYINCIPHHKGAKISGTTTMPFETVSRQFNTPINAFFTMRQHAPSPPDPRKKIMLFQEKSRQLVAYIDWIHSEIDRLRGTVSSDPSTARLTVDRMATLKETITNRSPMFTEIIYDLMGPVHVKTTAELYELDPHYMSDHELINRRSQAIATWLNEVDHLSQRLKAIIAPKK